MSFRIHLLGLPNAPLHPDYCLDGFAQAGHRFARMIKSLGHEVILYAAEGSNAECDEFVPIISDRERKILLGTCEYQHAAMDERYPLWQLSNATAAAEIRERKRPGDFLLTIGGSSQKPVFDFNPDCLGVEYSIGYSGNFCEHRVFESYAWLSFCYGKQNVEDVRFFDTVIPLFYDPADFPFVEKPEKYILFVGRLITRKGLGIACQAATAAGVKLKIIGHGGDLGLITNGHEYLGPAPEKLRNEYISKALAVICPTIYFEPFNGVAVESQLCGTPVISTDCGGFTETVEQGKTGFRCSLLGDFVRAIKQVEALDRRYIRERATRLYSMWNLRHDYQRYFERVRTRLKDGWNTIYE